MRFMKPLGLGAVLMLCACTVPSLEELLSDRSVKVEATFDFKAGCIAVLARDKAAPDKSRTTRFEAAQLDASKRRVDTEVQRGADWGPTLEIIATAHEQSCTGPEVARSTKTVTLDTEGVKTVSLALSAVDADGDGFVPTSGGGTDCDDNNAAVSQRTFYRDGDGDGYGAGEPMKGCVAPAQYVARDGDCDDTTTERAPGRTELCDGLDNDCANGIDNGLVLSSFYLDADHDGAGAGPVVMACAAPPNHVASSDDCDDSDPQRKPGLAEVCDDKDNDCDNLVDEGLPVSTFYRDRDGDGFGTATDTQQKCRAPTGYVVGNTDCNDNAVSVNPNAREVCNDFDDNCRNGVDEGFNKVWYRDADGDTYGKQSDSVTGCTPPAGYVAPTSFFDCNDSDRTVNPGATEKCNDIDDNCMGGTDEPFTSGSTRKGDSCSTPCTGIYVCNAAQDGTICNAPSPTNYYTDADGDGDGATSATAQPYCPGQSVPPNLADRNTDCDDTDKYNKGNGIEVCDQRDNNCNAPADEDNVCMGGDWKALTDPAVMGRDWNTVAINKDSASGYPVWIAGANGALARRSGAGETFTSFDGECGFTTWNAAWVGNDGSVYLAGNAGKLARYTGTACDQLVTLVGVSNVTGIIGFEDATLTLYAVDENGRLHSWVPGNTPVRLDDNAPIYRDVHGFDRTRLFIAGEDGTNKAPVMETYTGGLNTTNMSVSGPTGASLRSVWMASPTLAYAVGDSSMILRWSGTSWAAVTPPAVGDYTSVCAPDSTSVYVTNATGVIYRYTGVQWLPPLYTSSPPNPLRDIASVNPANIWAVGPGGRVIHFPELP
ncbi:putative metal-binding motif-containing protein [Pyxidicoccus parkwayensis]|uniref:Metal-binding motif-containing protein n=1 Tax=Pyxidicoccus parkwayensis TaxID=2813578 RepID=A0ABX7P8N4_9BACT|nr:putative metal-binding motif-containing protein [Pyxidicoccus parkwaysis]QSQ26823.1 putative metal-binding motif-containing protein [Pyxidicoccus parkwaysis]